MMNLPKSITVFVLNNCKIISGLVCSVELLTRHKNNFSLGLYRTDENGSFIITKEKIEFKIKEDTEFFLMDYNNSPENLTGCVEIRIEKIEDLQERANRIKKFFPEKINDIEFILNNNKNDMISSTITKIFQIDNSIVVNI